MNVIWVSDDPAHASAGDRADSYTVVPPDAPPEAGAGADLIVVYANSVEHFRARRLGLSWLQRHRLSTRSAAPAVVYSFEPRAALANDYSMLGRGMPGVAYLRLPVSSSDFRECLEGLSPLTSLQLEHTLRWHCGLEDEWHSMAHTMAGAVAGWPRQLTKARSILGVWAESVRSYAQDQIPALSSLESSLDEPGVTAERLRARIQELEDGLCVPTSAAGTGPGREVPPAPHDRPPRGYSAVVVADDTGYEVSTIEQLRLRGYDVAEPALNLSEADSLLRYWRPQVVLADLNFPSAEEGRELVRRALENGCMVIAVSKARVAEGDLPPGAEDCCGSMDFQDAERIHRLIWRRALLEGVTEHV